MRVYYFRCYWPSNLVFVVRCDLHFKFEEDRTKTAIAIVNDRYFRQTDIHTSDFISVQCRAFHWTDNKQFMT